MTLEADLARFARQRLTGPTPIEPLRRLSRALGGPDIHVKRDDLTSFALGGNKVRKLEFLVADALARGADTLVTAGAVQSNHVRQTAAAAACFGLGCVALLEDVLPESDDDYRGNGNRLLLDLFGTTTRVLAPGGDIDAALADAAAELAAAGRRPCVVPVGGSSALGALGYVACALEIARQAAADGLSFDLVVLPSGSAGTHAGLLVGLAEAMPEAKVVGVTVSRPRDQQEPKVTRLVREVQALLGRPAAALDGRVHCWDAYYAPGYGVPNAGGAEAMMLAARHEGVVLDPVYTGKAMAGLVDHVRRGDLGGARRVLFVHTGGSPANFAYRGWLHGAAAAPHRT